MPVRVVKPNNSLSPVMLFTSVQIFYIECTVVQLIQKFINMIFLKVKLCIIAAPDNFSINKCLPKLLFLK